IDIQRTEIIADVVKLETSSQFDDSDTLTRAIGLGEIVDLSDFVRIVGGRRGVRLNAVWLRQPAKVWLRLWTTIQPEHTSNDVSIFSRYADCANPAAVISLGMTVFLQFNMERLLHIGNRS